MFNLTNDTSNASQPQWNSRKLQRCVIQVGVPTFSTNVTTYMLADCEQCLFVLGAAHMEVGDPEKVRYLTAVWYYL